jgi:hypothetical protein
MSAKLLSNRKRWASTVQLSRDAMGTYRRIMVYNTVQYEFISLNVQRYVASRRKLQVLLVTRALNGALTNFFFKHNNQMCVKDCSNKSRPKGLDI